MLRFIGICALYTVGSFVVLGAAANYADKVLYTSPEPPSQIR